MAIDTTMVRSRRSLLTATLAGLVGAVATTAAGAHRVLAAGSDGAVIHIGDEFLDVRSTTVLINNTDPQPVLTAQNNQGGTGIKAHSDSGFGVAAGSSTGEGVFGSSGAGTGVHGVAGSNVAISRNYPAAVLGEALLPAGVSILGNNYATGGTAQGVQGTTNSPTGLATTGWATAGGTGVIGFVGAMFPTVPAETGVYGIAPSGRGVVASGGAAQVRLVPSSDATHPISGRAGDLFVDNSHRLWFCLGSTSWKRVKLV